MTVATLNPLQFGQAWKLMQARGQSKILASPQLTTLDNHSAETQITTTIYIEGSVSNMNRSNSFNNQNQNQIASAGGGATNSNLNNQNFNARQITEKDVGIDLQVTPRINDENRITLMVNASVEALLSAAEVSTDKPRATRRTVRTQVTVNTGDTVIIGGLISENAIENKKFIPVLSELPFIGKMFRSTTIDKEQRELLIFITPNVVG
jgi:general secretion pathway protein D